MAAPGVYAASDPREAHLATPTATGAGVRASALQAFGAHLVADENLARRMRTNARRALAELGYLSDAEKRALANVDRGVMGQLLDVSDKYKKTAVGTRAIAGVPVGNRYGELVGNYPGGGGGAPAGWDGIGPPSGPGISVGGIEFPGRPGQGAGRGEGGGLGDLGRYGSHGGNAMDPKSPTGGPLAGGGGATGTGPFSLPDGSKEGWGEVPRGPSSEALHGMHSTRGAT